MSRVHLLQWRQEAGQLSLIALAATQWLLILLAWLGAFSWWPLTLFPLGIALVGAIFTLLRQPRVDQVIMLGIGVLGVLLFTPPAEHLPFFGDSAIYVNEGLFLARTGGLVTTHPALAALPLETRTLFYTTNREQFPTHPLHAYQGFVYGGYYVLDAATMTIRTSRMALSEVWFALLSLLGGVKVALYSTPAFAIAALLLLYAIARHLLRRPLALWAVVLLAVSYPQLHFARTAYAEIAGQFWTLAGVLYALRWIEQRRPVLLVMALCCWVTTWSGRIDALLLLGSAGLLLLYAAYAREGRTLRAVLLALPFFGGLIWIGTNGAYVGATYEILVWRWPWFGNALVALSVALVLGVAIIWRWGSAIVGWLRRFAPFLHGLIFLALLLVILWATIPNPLRDSAITRNYQEIIWFSSAYITAGLYWLMVAGVGWLLWRGYTAQQFWLLATFLSLAALFLYRYTSAPVYPVSLRRLISDLIPLMILLAGIALAAPWPVPQWSKLRWVVALALLGWMGWLSLPLLQQAEAAGSLATIEQLQATLPPDAIVIFEVQDGDSWVGWLAGSLYSLYGRWALQLDSDTPDPALWRTAVTALQATGRPLYLISQHTPLPAPLLPTGYTTVESQQLVWHSSLIGQTRAPYPPPYWEFAHPLQLYQVQATTTK